MAPKSGIIFKWSLKKQRQACLQVPMVASKLKMSSMAFYRKFADHWGTIFLSRKHIIRCRAISFLRVVFWLLNGQDQNPDLLLVAFFLCQEACLWGSSWTQYNLENSAQDFSAMLVGNPGTVTSRGRMLVWKKEWRNWKAQKRGENILSVIFSLM